MEQSKLICRIDNLKKKMIDLKVRNLHGPDKVFLSDNDIIALCLVKNGEIYVDDFVKYYLNLGVKHIVFLDNGSSDRTVEFASKFDKVTVLQTDFPFRNSNEMRMRDYLIDRFATNHWSLCLDIDEFFDYPYSDRISLDKLIQYMNQNSYTALVCNMLDIFPYSISRDSENIFIMKNHEYYDISAIKKIDYFYDDGRVLKGEIKIFLGGIRRILFGLNCFLVKHPLIFKNKNTTRSRFGHTLVNGKIADFSAVLLHYKFTRDFFYYAEDAVNRQYHFKSSLDHRHYKKVLFNKKELILKQATSKKYEGISELIKNNFLIVSKKFKDFAENSQ